MVGWRIPQAAVRIDANILASVLGVPHDVRCIYTGQGWPVSPNRGGSRPLAGTTLRYVLIEKIEALASRQSAMTGWSGSFPDYFGPGKHLEGFIWWAQLLFEGLDAYVDARWDPEAREFRIRTECQETLTRARDFDRLTLGAKALRDFARGGRHRLESDPMTPGRRDMVQRAEQMKRQHPSLSWGQIAASLGENPSTLKKWRLRLGTR